MNYYHDWWENARKQKSLILTKPVERKLLQKKIKTLTTDLTNEQANTQLAKQEVQRLNNALTDTNNDLKAANKVIKGWEKADQNNKELLKKAQQIIEKFTKIVTDADTRLDTLYKAIEGDQLGKDWKKLTLNYVKAIRTVLENK